MSDIDMPWYKQFINRIVLPFDSSTATPFNNGDFFWDLLKSKPFSGEGHPYPELHTNYGPAVGAAIVSLTAVAIVHSFFVSIYRRVRAREEISDYYLFQSQFKQWYPSAQADKQNPYLYLLGAAYYYDPELPQITQFFRRLQGRLFGDKSWSALQTKLNSVSKKERKATLGKIQKECLQKIVHELNSFQDANGNSYGIWEIAKQDDHSWKITLNNKFFKEKLTNVFDVSKTGKIKPFDQEKIQKEIKVREEKWLSLCKEMVTPILKQSLKKEAFDRKLSQLNGYQSPALAWFKEALTQLEKNKNVDLSSKLREIKIAKERYERMRRQMMRLERAARPRRMDKIVRILEAVFDDLSLASFVFWIGYFIAVCVNGVLVLPVCFAILFLIGIVGTHVFNALLSLNKDVGSGYENEKQLNALIEEKLTNEYRILVQKQLVLKNVLAEKAAQERIENLAVNKQDDKAWGLFKASQLKKDMTRVLARKERWIYVNTLLAGFVPGCFVPFFIEWLGVTTVKLILSYVLTATAVAQLFNPLFYAIAMTVTLAVALGYGMYKAVNYYKQQQQELDQLSEQFEMLSQDEKSLIHLDLSLTEYDRVFRRGKINASGWTWSKKISQRIWFGFVGIGTGVLFLKLLPMGVAVAWLGVPPAGILLLSALVAGGLLYACWIVWNRHCASKETKMNTVFKYVRNPVLGNEAQQKIVEKTSTCLQNNTVGFEPPSEKEGLNPSPSHQSFSAHDCGDNLSSNNPSLTKQDSAALPKSSKLYPKTSEIFEISQHDQADSQTKLTESGIAQGTARTVGKIGVCNGAANHQPETRKEDIPVTVSLTHK